MEMQRNKKASYAANDIRRILGICIESSHWDEAYALAKKEPAVPEWLTEGYLNNLHAQYGVLPKSLEMLTTVVSYVAEVEPLCLLAKTLYHILGTKEKFTAAFTEFELPVAPKDARYAAAYDCVAIFPIIAHIRPTWEVYQRRGVAEDILTPSLQWAESIFLQSVENNGRTAFTAEYFRLYGVAIYTNHLTIGRLRFEIHENSKRPVRIFRNRQGKLCPLFEDVLLHRSGHILGSVNCTDTEGSYAAEYVESADAYVGYTLDTHTRLAVKKRVCLEKSEWEPVYASGDTALKVHIPYGGKMTKEMCAESYKRAREVYTRCFPEYDFRCFLICCWMLSPELKDILPETSNIIAFQNDYLVYPMKNAATDALLYVFGIEGKTITDISFAELPEDNSLQRGIKKKGLEGRYIYQFGGYIPW